MQWETKPCLLWDYSQDKALSGCSDIVSPVREQKNSLKNNNKNKNKKGGGEDTPCIRQRQN